MAPRHGVSVGWRMGLAVVALVALAGLSWASYIEEEFSPGRGWDRPSPPLPPPPPPLPGRVIPPPPPPPPSGHVPELARYLDLVELRRPLVCGRLAVFPVALRGGDVVGGGWWTLDAALARGILVAAEKDGGGTVPIVWMENRSRHDYVFVMAGEVVRGGKQTRTVREDVVLAPGQRADVPVLCVEQHRWRGEAGFSGAGLLVPQSIQRRMRQGADQSAVWGEVARSNEALGTENPTGSLELGLKAAPVRRELDDVRRWFVPEMPRDSVGFLFADRYGDRVLGAEFFGRADLAAALLPKLVDAYAVDLVVAMKEDRERGTMGEGAARRFLDLLRRAGSYPGATPGSGTAIRMRWGGLVGDGVSLGGVVHFGCQVEDVVRPAPRPPGPWR